VTKTDSFAFNGKNLNLKQREAYFPILLEIGGKTTKKFKLKKFGLSPSQKSQLLPNNPPENFPSGIKLNYHNYSKR
jgi:hypothetical protein